MVEYKEEQETYDTALKGQIKLIQPKNGYRFSVDALLVAYFSHHSAGDLAVDLGCGCGIISLLLLYSNKAKKVAGVEIQKELAELAEKNAEINNHTDSIKIYHNDIKEIQSVFKPKSARLVISNPPFFAVGDGRDNPVKQISIARREKLVTMEEIVKAAKYLLMGSGKLSLIYPAERLYELFSVLEKYKLPAKRIRLVHGKPNEKARMVLVEAANSSGKSLVVESPLVLENEDNSPTDEAEKIVSGKW